MKCVFKSDIEPQRKDIKKLDAFDIDIFMFMAADLIITNPPWDRKILHPLLLHFVGIIPTWLLFDADWIHTKQSVEYLPYLRKIVSVGRVKWIADSQNTGKDNCCWYYFDNYSLNSTPKFFGRSL